MRQMCDTFWPKICTGLDTVFKVFKASQLGSKDLFHCNKVVTGQVYRN